MATPPPPLSPAVATPLAHRKRRHSEANGIEHPHVIKQENGARQGQKVPAEARLKVPQDRGRAAMPVKRYRSETPSSSAKNPAVKSNGAPSPRPSGSTGPGAASGPAPGERFKLTPRPGSAGRPSASPRPSVTSRPSASPRPGISKRPSASPRPINSGRASASPRPRVKSRPSPSPRPKAAQPRRIEDTDSDDGSDIGKSDIEDIVDSVELEPFTSAEEDDNPETLDTETAANLRQRLLKVGPQEFMEETLDKARMPPQVLGTAFGLDPSIRGQVGNDIFLRILGQIIVRQYFKRQKLPQYNTLDDVAELLNKSSKIVVIAGAGISTSLGIPDFRSKHTGFYARAAEKAEAIGHYLAAPEDIFDLPTFDDHPEIFYKLAGDILPNEKKFSPTHAFIKLLQDKDKLLTCYTQNIDNLEQSAGISADKLIQCHGSFATATCRRNGVKNEAHRVPGSAIFPAIRAGKVAECEVCKSELAAKREEKKAQAQKTKKKPRFLLSPNKHGAPSDEDEGDDDDDLQPGIMKPDITFFGEALPNTFFTRFTTSDCAAVDLVLVLGTSLKVAPVSEMPNYLPHDVPHVYVSREAIRHVEFDVQCLGDCDDVVVELCRRAGWTGKESRGVVGHEMVEGKDLEGRAIVVEAEGEGEEGWKWRVRREEAVF